MSLRAGTQRDMAFQEYAANAAMMSAAEWHEECEAQSVERSNAAANAAMMSAVEWHEECEAQSVERSNAAANAAMKCGLGRFHKMYLMNPNKEWRNEG